LFRRAAGEHSDGHSGERVLKVVGALELDIVTAEDSLLLAVAAKDNLIAVFGVDIKRVPFFFRDREHVFDAKTGKKKRIFHIVRPHPRVTSSTGVKMHFRGLRKFAWNGYGISITVPGRDHENFYELDLPAIDSSRLTRKERKQVVDDVRVADAMRLNIGGMGLRQSFESIIGTNDNADAGSDAA